MSGSEVIYGNKLYTHPVYLSQIYGVFTVFFNNDNNFNMV